MKSGKDGEMGKGSCVDVAFTMLHMLDFVTIFIYNASRLLEWADFNGPGETERNKPSSK